MWKQFLVSDDISCCPLQKYRKICRSICVISINFHITYSYSLSTKTTKQKSSPGKRSYYKPIKEFVFINLINLCRKITQILNIPGVVQISFGNIKSIMQFWNLLVYSLSTQNGSNFDQEQKMKSIFVCLRMKCWKKTSNATVPLLRALHLILW
jgi:hypothetical protein